MQRFRVSGTSVLWEAIQCGCGSPLWRLLGWHCRQWRGIATETNTLIGTAGITAIPATHNPCVARIGTGTAPSSDMNGAAAIAASNGWIGIMMALFRSPTVIEINAIESATEPTGHRTVTGNLRQSDLRD